VPEDPTELAGRSSAGFELEPEFPGAGEGAGADSTEPAVMGAGVTAGVGTGFSAGLLEFAFAFELAGGLVFPFPAAKELSADPESAKAIVSARAVALLRRFISLPDSNCS